MLSQTLGAYIDGIPCEYQFNTIRTIKFRNLISRINRFIFRLRCKIDCDTYYVTHDIETGAILAKLGKPYSLVYHNQGPIIQEKYNFGSKLSEEKLKYWKTCERLAFLGAKSLHFPSSGAAEMFFSNIYASCKKNEVNLSVPLYNTIPNENIKPVSGLDKKGDTLTFFSLGSLTEAKGQDRSILFIEKYLETYVGQNIRYIVVGKGPLEQLICKKGAELMKLYPNFEFVYYNSLRHSEVAYVHEISDVYLMLHRLSIFDFATLEAMFAKTAVVLSPVGGNIDFNKNDNIIFASGDYYTAIAQITAKEINKLKLLNYETYQRYFSASAFSIAYKEIVRKNILAYE